VDGELAAALAPEYQPIVWLQSIRTEQGRELCFVPCVPEWARMLMAAEADAKEYGARPAPLDLEAFRVIRGERSRCSLEAHKRRIAEAKRDDA